MFPYIVISALTLALLYTFYELGLRVRQLQEVQRTLDDAEAFTEAAGSPLQNARDLLPAFCSADPSAPTAGNVRLAFRAHCLWANDCNVVVLGWHDLLRMKLDDNTLFLQLCELYSRSIFECAFCQHFDGASPETDAIVLSQIRDAFSDETAFKVHTMVATRGIVLRRFTTPAPTPGRPEAA